MKIRWVIGEIDRRSKKLFLKDVNKRDANALLDVTEKNVQSGTTIITNMWRSYNSLQSKDCTHLRVSIRWTLYTAVTWTFIHKTSRATGQKWKKHMRRRVGRIPMRSFEGCRSLCNNVMWTKLNLSYQKNDRNILVLN